MPERSRLVGLAVALALVIAACVAPAGDRATPSAAEAPATGADTLPEGPSALRTLEDPALPEPLVDPEMIISGGVPPDGIPPIDDPSFVAVAEVDWIRDREGVAVVVIGGDARAYPAQILIWHEIVNDTVGGVPVAITYCPLCNSSVAYERTIDGVVTTFGTSGRLFASALVMYDRATESLWTHFDGRAVAGVLTGRRLDPVPAPLMSWEEFRTSYPDGLVLDKFRTGNPRRYGDNPYVGYDDPDGFPYLFLGEVDDRSRAMQRVVGVEVDGVAKAWSLDVVSGGEARATDDSVGETLIVLFWRAGQASAVHQFQTDIGRMVGTVGVFSPVVDGRSLTFIAEGDHFVDNETRSRWDITGRSVSGPMRGVFLERIHHLDAFWFAWSTYQPDTALVEG